MNVSVLHTKLILLFCILFFSNTVFAQQIYYINGAAGSPGNGNSWNSPYQNLLVALHQVCGIEEAIIWVAEGTYYPDFEPYFDEGDRNARFHMCNNVKIYGGFPASGNPDFDDRNPELYPTILSGDLGKNDEPSLAFNALIIHQSRSDNAYSVVFAENLDNTALLDGFVIRDGNADGATGSPFAATRAGAGIYISGGSPVIQNCTFIKNSTATTGGAILVTNNATPLLYQNTIISNFTNGDGGGIYNNTSSPHIINCKFALNRAMNSGGAILNNFNASPRIYGCVFLNNVALDGGGISNFSSSSPQIYNGSFSGNFAGSNGGAIYNAGNCNPSIKNCAIWNNAAQNSSLSVSASIHNTNSSFPNIAYSNIQNAFNPSGDWVTSIGTNSGSNIMEDPLFMEIHTPLIAPAEIGDLNIDEDSPCVNAGDPASHTYGLPERDIIGNLRISGEYIDIGAYEFPMGNDVFTQNISPVQFSIFPNPIQQQVFIRSTYDRADILIFDLKGQALIHKRNANLSSSLDISMLPVGNYFITLIYKNIHLGTVPVMKME